MVSVAPVKEIGHGKMVAGMGEREREYIYYSDIIPMCFWTSSLNSDQSREACPCVQNPEITQDKFT